jgi:peptide/nickel transport system substrate-binding protein
MPEGFLNYGDYNNPRIVEIVQQSASVVDADERIAAYDEAQQIAMEDLPFVPLAQPNYVVAMRDHLQGYTYANDQLYRFWTLYKEQP